MRLPSNYQWTVDVGGYVHNSRQKKYKVRFFSYYGDELLSFTGSFFEPNNLNDVPAAIARLNNLSVSNYSRIIRKRSKPEVDKNTYRETKVYSYSRAIFNKNYFANKTYGGYSLGKFVSLRKGDINGRQGYYDVDVYYYENGLVLVKEKGSNFEFTNTQGKTIKGNSLKSSSDVYLKINIDTRIPTNCCLKYLCNPTKYKKA